MKTKTNVELVRQLQGNACREKEMLCRKVTGDLLRTLWAKHRDGIAWDKSKDQANHLMIIARCASLLAKLRGTLNTDRERNEAGEDLVYHSPVIEKPDRLNQLLYNLARGHAVALGREQITDEDMPCVVLLACDSAPGHRAELLHALIDRGGKITTGQVEKVLKVSKPTALHEMQTMKILGICEEWDPDDLTTEKGIQFQEDFMWFSSEECRSHFKWNTGSELLNSNTE